MKVDMEALLDETAICISKQLLLDMIVGEQSKISKRSFYKRIDNAVAAISEERHLNQEQLLLRTIEVIEAILSRTVGISRIKRFGFEGFKIENDTPAKTDQIVRYLNETINILEKEKFSQREDASLGDNSLDTGIYEIEELPSSADIENNTTYSENAINKLKKKIADIESGNIRR